MKSKWLTYLFKGSVLLGRSMAPTVRKRGRGGDADDIGEAQRNEMDTNETGINESIGDNINGVENGECGEVEPEKEKKTNTRWE